MLKEMRSNAFKINATKPNEIIRPKIIFNDSLNVVLGPNDFINSIGKSNLLMCIDFAFGGNDYIDKVKSVIKNVGDHEINFAHEFDEKIYYFSRTTHEPDIIYICNENYLKTGDKMTLTNFNNWLKDKNLIANKQTWRQIVSRYIRVYNRENDNEKEPLRNATNEPPSTAIESLLKLYNMYSPIESFAEEAKKSKEKKSTFTKAQDYNYIPKIGKKQYEANEKRIIELEAEKQIMAEKSHKNLLELNSEKALAIKDLKAQLSQFKRQRGRFYDQLNTIKKNKEFKSVVLQNDFSALEEFFPNQVSIERLQTIESFHKNITSILKDDFASAESKAWNLINLVNIQISNIEEKINQVEGYSDLSKVVLENYATIDREITELKNQNKKYDALGMLTKEANEKEEKLIDKQMAQQLVLQTTINNKMNELNSYIFGKDKNVPVLEFKSTKSYDFYTINDEGTGTNYKGLIIFDLSCLALTDVPFLVHDSFLFKNISRHSMEKLIDLYLQTGYQVFISIDNINSYTDKTIKNLTDYKVIELSGDGNELYGRKW